MLLEIANKILPDSGNFSGDNIVLCSNHFEITNGDQEAVAVTLTARQLGARKHKEIE